MLSFVAAWRDYNRKLGIQLRVARVFTSRNEWPKQTGQTDVQLKDAWLHCIVSDSNAGQMCMNVG